MKNLSIIIPVYNNSQTLKKLTIQIYEILNKLNYKDYQIVFVDDSSEDNSLKVLHDLKKKFKKIKIITNPINLGQSRASIVGLKYSISKNYIIMSADLQDDPKYIKNHLTRLKKNDIVFAYRDRLVGNWFVKLTSRVHYTILKTQVKNFPKYGVDFYSFKRNIRNLITNDSQFIDSMNLFLINLSSHHKSNYFYYRKNERVIGKSQYTFFKRLFSHIDLIQKTEFFSKLFWSFSILLIFCFIGWGLYILYSFFSNPNPSYTGWRSIILLIILFNSIILIRLNLMDNLLKKLSRGIRNLNNL